MRHLWRLRPYLHTYRLQITLSLVSLLLLTAAQLVIPTIIRRVIDQGVSNADTGFLIRAALLLLCIGGAIAALSYVQRYLSEWIATHIGYDLRNQLYNHIQHLSFSYHDHTQTGQLISRCIEDVRAIERFTGTGVVDLIRLTILLVGIISLLFVENPQLSIIALTPMIPLLIITSNFGRKASGLFLAVDNSLGELSSLIQENVSGVQVVRAFAREPHEINRFNQANRQLFNARLTVLGEWSKIMPSATMLVSLGTILILWFGGQMVINGQMTVGEVVAFNSYLLLLSQPAQQLTWLVNIAGEAIAGVQRTYEILDQPPDIRSPEVAIVLPPLTGRVDFQDVSFRYQDDSTPALKDIQLHVEPNQVIALIGATGSGKSSMINLIPRFYDASAGKVLVDGYDVREANLESLRRQIGIVLQTSLLFSITVRENIAYGRPDASEEEIITAAKSSQAHEFILQLPDGYDTIVGERGVTLSGGQRQRVAIARALLMDPRILILDDSTSSVDMQTERMIQQALETLMEGRTTFVIAHRMSTVRRADQIIVMDQGCIVERGTHQELIHLDGLYRQIYELQLRDQERFHSEIEALEDLTSRYLSSTRSSRIEN